MDNESPHYADFGNKKTLVTQNLFKLDCSKDSANKKILYLHIRKLKSVDCICEFHVSGDGI